MNNYSPACSSTVYCKNNLTLLLSTSKSLYIVIYYKNSQALFDRNPIRSASKCSMFNHYFLAPKLMHSIHYSQTLLFKLHCCS